MATLPPHERDDQNDYVDDYVDEDAPVSLPEGLHLRTDPDGFQWERLVTHHSDSPEYRDLVERSVRAYAHVGERVRLSPEDNRETALLLEQECTRLGIPVPSYLQEWAETARRWPAEPQGMHHQGRRSG